MSSGKWRIEVNPRGILTRIFRDGEEVKDLTFVGLSAGVNGFTELTLKAVLMEPIEVEGEFAVVNGDGEDT